MEIFIFLIVMGVISGMIANNKKRSFGKWFIYGFFLGLIAIVHACIITDKEQGKKCPECLSMVDNQAQVCKYCRHKFTKEEIREINQKIIQEKAAKDKHNGKMGIALVIVGIIFWILIQVLINGH